jgi:hypothetical protein
MATRSPHALRLDSGAEELVSQAMKAPTRSGSQSGEQPVNIDLLASDLATLLEALRVPPKAARLTPCLAVGFGSGRVGVASNEGPNALRVQKSSVQNEPIVGEELAELTTRRWFVPESYQTQPEVLAPVKEGRKDLGLGLV